ncbi:MAG TPA: hypothetical protein VD993_07790 [Chitinophagaceae bacterium]|nr:hypothetical protein [Chitinophagaceae bacterium]
MKKAVFIIILFVHLHAVGQRKSFFLDLQNRNAYREIKGIYPVASSDPGDLYEITYDEKKRPVSVVYSRAGQLKRAPELGTVRMVIEYTDSAEYRYFKDAGNLPDKNPNGVFVEKYVYDKKGRKKRLDYLDGAGQLTESPAGVARIYFETDEKGRIIKETQISSRGRVVPRGAVNYYQTGFVYDDKDRMIELYNIDSAGRRAANSIGLASMRMTWNKMDKEISWSYHDITGKIMRRKDINIAKGVYMIDDRGKIISTSYLDENNQPVNYRNSVAMAISFFTPAGDLVEQRFYDKELRLVNSAWTNFALVRYHSDGSQRKEQRFFSSDFE